ncbi:hypothetical protein CR205_10240 [Alteribacter lacisalsi]|jgi:hypothetical protein|uniref:Uncharacterized protein n=1 Tax=Alteribacter lacisalsi TaxID=2045244 RepID=A0A2W0HAP0_9BACI|nr:hypothetical protein [Alteribacter lacisalsi]PYZ98923.1 hypothetical protein CR205_10240 [Alteribacter lacisalsi]
MGKTDVFIPVYVIAGMCFLTALAAAYMYDSEVLHLTGRIGLIGLLIVLLFRRKTRRRSGR